MNAATILCTALNLFSSPGVYAWGREQNQIFHFSKAPSGAMLFDHARP
jgi:hypothetical protein